MVLPRRFNFVAPREVVSKEPSRLFSGSAATPYAMITAEGESRSDKGWSFKGEKCLMSTAKVSKLFLGNGKGGGKGVSGCLLVFVRSG